MKKILINASDKQIMKEILSAYKFTFEYEQDDDGRYAGSLKQISDIVADGTSIEILKTELARQLIEYAKDYDENFPHYYNATNRHEHYPYVLRVLLEDDFESVSAMLNTDILTEPINDTVYVVIDLFELTDSIAGATTDINTANMLCASALEGHSRFIEMYENGVKVGEGGFRE